MKRFIFIYLISFILCISSLTFGEEMPSDGCQAAVSADVISDGNFSMVDGSAISVPVNATTEAGNTFITQEDLPGGAARITSPAAVTTGEAIYTTGSEKILAAAPLAAATGGYMTVTVTPATYNMGVLYSESTYTYTGAVVLSVSAKSVWNLQVSGTDFSNGTYTIPVNRMKCKVSTSSEYKTLSSAPLDLLTNQSKAWPSNTTVQIDYQITVLRTDPAGTNFQNTLTFLLY